MDNIDLDVTISGPLDLRLHGPQDAEALIVLYAGGWADVDIVPPDLDEATCDYVELREAADFGPVLARACAGTLGLR